MAAPTTVVVRAASGPRTGLGHVRRCLTLAGALREHGIASLFLLDSDATAEQLVQTAGHTVGTGATSTAAILAAARQHDAAAIVVDSYAVGADDLHALRNCAAAVLAVLDDLADRVLPVDLLVNGAAGAERLPYQTLATTRRLLGPRYALLRPEFTGLPLRPAAPRVRRVLVTLGGGDQTDLAGRVLSAVLAADDALCVDLVLGPYAAEAVPPKCSRVQVHRDPPSMCALMTGVDLAVSAGGQTLYELAAAGVPTIGIQVANNQRTNLDGLARSGALEWIGNADDPDLGLRLTVRVRQLSNAPERRARLASTAQALVDGHGARRVALELAELIRVSGSTVE